MVRDWAADMDVTPRTRSSRVTLLRTALDDAVDDGLIIANPLAGKKLKQQRVTVQSQSTQIDPFSWAEREAIEVYATPQFALLIRFADSTS
tara:strand:+ start:467 stop:739 length:273 start_codon:yes stop_codon:yes gene_type:complete